MLKSATFSGLKGLRNTVAQERIEADELVDGINIDLDSDGRLSRREGYTKHITTSAAHSLWSDGDQAYYVEGTDLYRVLDTDPLTSESIYSGLTGTRLMSYDSTNGVVYFSNGEDTGKIVNGVHGTWGIEPPENPPYLAEGVGDLPAGRYGVTYVFVDENGVESGAPSLAFVHIAKNRGIDITGIESSSYATRVYITTPNGMVPYAALELAPGVTSAQYRGLVNRHLPLETQFLRPAPAGHLVRYYNGRMYVAQGNFLRYSLPFKYDLFDLREYVPLKAHITMIAPVTNGLFVGTTQNTVFFAGKDPQDFTPQIVANYGAVEGTHVMMNEVDLLDGSNYGKANIWFSHEGVCIGTDGRGFSNLTADKYIAPTASRGAGVIRIRDGMNQYVSTLFD